MASPCIISTQTIALSMSGVALEADLVISPDLENRIVVRGDGVYANIFRLAYWQQADDPTIYYFNDDIARSHLELTIPFTNPGTVNIIGNAHASFDPAFIAVHNSNVEFAHFHQNNWIFIDETFPNPSDNRAHDLFGPAAATPGSGGGAMNTLGDAGGGVATIGFTIPPGATRTFHMRRDIQRIGGGAVNPSGYDYQPNGFSFSATFVG